ncbi:PssD/Cps14F family polysaccharide biosynthesis glycosyltransferase [Schaedlerella sp.]|uniref:PssD/Cps14F family polysaccharide biosynthesis glycosyltransferase n=1 Tax=Schaedlerella sp. TaxID=2676057 RepID=UPI003746B0CA
MKNKKIKICFAASSGGHLEELMMLRPLMGRYDSFIVTERTMYEAAEEGIRFYYLQQVNRREKSCFLRLLANTFLSLRILFAEQPDVVITTGVLAVIPLCLLCRLWGAKLVFIESYANVHSPTRTGKFLYRFADRFYVQWPELLEFYPGAVYLGGIY